MTFDERLKKLREKYEALIARPNEVDDDLYNGIYDRYKYPILTAAHTPLEWRYDLNPETNPFLMERMGINAVFNSGAMEWNGKIVLCCRVEGMDRKSFFAMAESDNGVDNFRFWDEPTVVADEGETNQYDMRLVRHEDGWIYGTFCAESHDDSQPDNPSAAVAASGIARTKDLVNWERLPNLKSEFQQRNVVIHPEFVNGKYMLYTRPQEGFGGSGGGIGYAFCDDMTRAVVGEEKDLDPRVYHTIKEVKNGMGASPLKTEKGWLHVDHGFRGTATGARYVLYAYLCDLEDPTRVTHRPGGYVIAPVGWEYVGDVDNCIFSNGMVLRDNGDLFIYYASCDTRMHVAKTTVNRMLDYVMNTPEDGLTTNGCVAQRLDLIRRNAAMV